MVVGRDRFIESVARRRVGVDQQVVGPVFSCSTPAGATPMSFRPKRTVTGELTVAPACGVMK
jgi:hypothetical protein